FPCTALFRSERPRFRSAADRDQDGPLQRPAGRQAVRHAGQEHVRRQGLSRLPAPGLRHQGLIAIIRPMSARPKLLITRKVFPEVIERLAPHFEIDSNQDDEDWPRATLLARSADRDALFVVSSDRVDRELLAGCPRLRIVATGSVGYNHVDLAACGERGIAVSNTPDVLTEATADMAWALLMATARRVCESEHWLRAGKWGRWAFDQWLGADVHGATLGVVGMGRIGS